ncbi:MAG: UbiX family flavin prenyltransferase [marine benthic group bacterium]|jgi:4-hydroxy-3-polyprenylbenzoate decarboxylase|nr:UbiX family flavin prenyltransferase [Candidatus Benthicola marisminoris]
MSERRWLVGITGASGAPYAVRLLQELVELEVPTDVIVSAHGWRLFAHETGIGGHEELLERIGGAGPLRFFDNSDRGARPASGSAPYAGMVICPCSMGTLSAIAHGSSRSLVERAADVNLKERRKLVTVVRETPLSAIHLENLLALARLGTVVLPASPGFYHEPRDVGDLVDFIVARVLDHMHVEHEVGYRWTGEEESGSA